MIQSNIDSTNLLILRNKIYQGNLLIEAQKNFDLMGMKIFLLGLQKLNPHFRLKTKFSTKTSRSFLYRRQRSKRFSATLGICTRWKRLAKGCSTRQLKLTIRTAVLSSVICFASSTMFRQKVFIFGLTTFCARISWICWIRRVTHKSTRQPFSSCRRRMPFAFWS